MNTLLHCAGSSFTCQCSTASEPSALPTFEDSTTKSRSVSCRIWRPSTQRLHQTVRHEMW